ncbi:MAG: hypothetical protein LH614_21185 [Pyrinomonadaceae bacterium]|nr:hypothetical protein [Pyrinomonadaceae bacterium]
MFILESKTQLEKAIAKARKVKPIVKMIAFGVYAVKGSNGNSYTVKMERIGNEKRISCDCKGGERGLICHHGTAALELHSTLAKHRAATI